MLKKIYDRIISNILYQISRNTEEIIAKHLFVREVKMAIANIEDKDEQVKRDDRIVVSLTSFGKRVDEVYLTIYSLLKQTIKPDVIVLWLAENEFNDSDIPETLKSLKKMGLTIKYTKDIRSYKKLIPALYEYPNDIIVTVDDDMIYRADLVEKLYKSYLENPNCIICGRANQISFDGNESLKPYTEWDFDVSREEPSASIIATGVGGVLYFPGCLDKEVLNEKAFMSLSPTSDDIWFKCMATIKGVKYKIIDKNSTESTSNIRLNSYAFGELSEVNIHQGKNDLHFKNVIKAYQIGLEKFK